MEEKNILKGLKSSYIFHNIFDFIKDKNYKYKLFIYSKTLQNKLKINLFEYQKKYIDKLGIKNHKYLSFNYFIDDIKKDDLENKFKENFLNFKINKETFQNYLDDFFKNYHKNNILIDIFSPFFEFLSTKEYFEKFFIITINLIEKYQLDNDYINAFNKLNQSKSKYSSLEFIINKNIEIEKWKSYEINFEQIRNLTILEVEESSDSSNEKILKFINNIIDYKIFQNNLTNLEIYFNKNYSIDPLLFENINNFINLEILKLYGFDFTDIFSLGLCDLKELELIKCNNITFAKDSFLKLKKLLINDSPIRKPKNLNFY